MRNLNRNIKSALFGMAIGDALGVPAEFKSRQTILRKPVTNMIGYGTYHLPRGTFSDESQMTFCLAEALTHDFHLHRISQNFIKWSDENYQATRGELFDIGNATNNAMTLLVNGQQPELAEALKVNQTGMAL